MKTNYHSHHHLCGHAIGNIEDYVLEAIENKFDEIGISDHGPILAEAFPRMTYEEFEKIYLVELDEAIKKHSHLIKIYKGLEIEFVKGDEEHYKKLLEKVDYLILGCHYYEGFKNLHGYSSYAVKTSEQLESYTKLIEEALDTKLFKILAHPDLFMHGYRQFDSFAEECTKRIVDAVIRNDVLIEFNAGGIRTNRYFDENGNPDYAVPNHQFWSIVSGSNAKVILGSDCHKPEELNDKSFKFAEELMKSYNLNIVKKLF